MKPKITCDINKIIIHFSLTYKSSRLLWVFVLTGTGFFILAAPRCIASNGRSKRAAPKLRQEDGGEDEN